MQRAALLAFLAALHTGVHAACQSGLAERLHDKIDPQRILIHELTVCHAWHGHLGRSVVVLPTQGTAPGTLDLDILWFGDQVIDTPTLTVPHPRMDERAFVLRPLADLVPGRVSAAALQAVAAQSIYRLAGADWAEGAVGGDCS